MPNVPRILVTDDDSTIRVLLETVCRRTGFECDGARDGVQALAMIRSKRYDMLLLDLMMPNMSGYQVIAAIRDLPIKPVVIVVTAQGAKETAVIDRTIVHAVIEKPFTLNHVSEILVETAKTMAQVAHL